MIAPPVINSSGIVNNIQGDDAVLYCIAQSEPLHNVMWIAPDQSLLTFNNDK